MLMIIYLEFMFRASDLLLVMKGIRNSVVESRPDFVWSDAWFC